MRRWKSSLLLLAIAALGMAQTASKLQLDAIQRVGDKLACLCGACNNTVATCAMLECHYSKPAKEKIAEMAAAGKTDREILDYFIQREGLRALAEPPAEGFNLMGHVMPFLAFALGIWITWWFVRRFRGKPAVAGAEMDPETLARYQKRIESDMKELD